MKTKMFFVVCMLSIITTAFASDVAKKAIYLSPDCAKISEIAVTETHETGKYIIVIDTIKEYLVSKNARPYITQRFAEIVVLEGGIVWLEDSLMPRWTHTFGEDSWMPRRLVLTGNEVEYEERPIIVKPASTPGKISFELFLATMFWIIGLFTCLISDSKKSIKSLRVAIVGFFIIYTVLWICIIPLFDAVLYGTVIFLPALIVSFLFNKRINRKELNKKDFDTKHPLRIFENGDMILSGNSVLCSDNTIYDVCFVDKNYRKLKKQPYTHLYRTDFQEEENDVHIVGDDNNGAQTNSLFGIVDKNMNEVLPVQYSYISSFHHGLASVKNNENMFAYFSAEKRNLITPFKYKHASLFTNGRALVSDQPELITDFGNDNKVTEGPIPKYFIDTEGNPLSFEKLTKEEQAMLK